MSFNSKLLQLKREIKQLCEIDLWDNIDYESIRIWLKQFHTPEELLLGHLIVRNMVVRNEKQMTQLMLQAIRRALSHFIKDEDRYRFNWQQLLFEGYNSKTFFMGPVNFNIEGFGKPGKSGEIIIPLLKKYVPRDNFQYPDSYKSGLNAKEAFFLIDDAILSGHQIEERINRYYQNLMLDPNSASALVVGIAHEEALNYLSQKLPLLRIFYGELLTSDTSFVNLCTKWQETAIWPSNYTPPLDVFDAINKRATFSANYHLGHLNQALMLSYFYGAPDNTIQILRDNSTSWTSLVSR